MDIGIVVAAQGIEHIGLRWRERQRIHRGVNSADGSYCIGEGIIYSYPVTCRDGRYQIVQDLGVDAFSRGKLEATEKELREERDGVRELLG